MSHSHFHSSDVFSSNRLQLLPLDGLILPWATLGKFCFFNEDFIGLEFLVPEALWNTLSNMEPLDTGTLCSTLKRKNTHTQYVCIHQSINKRKQRNYLWLHYPVQFKLYRCREDYFLDGSLCISYSQLLQGKGWYSIDKQSRKAFRKLASCFGQTVSILSGTLSPFCFGVMCYSVLPMSVMFRGGKKNPVIMK